MIRYSRRTNKLIQPTPERGLIIRQMDISEMGQELRTHFGSQYPTFLLEDTQANRLMKGAYEYIESQLNRPFLTQTRQYRWSDLYEGGVRLDETPVQEIESVHIVDENEVEHLVPASNYRVHGAGVSTNITDKVTVAPKKNVQGSQYNLWSTGTDMQIEFGDQPYPLVIRAVVGWQTEDVPSPLQQAVLMVASDWHTNKTSASGMPSYRVKNDVESIISQFVRVKIMVV